MGIRGRAAPVWVIVAALAGGACDVSVDDGKLSVDLVSGLARHEEQRTYAIRPDGRFELRNRSGSIEIHAGDGPDLVVTITRQARARSDEAAEALLRQIMVVEDAGPSRVRLGAEAPRDSAIQVSYVVRAPRTLAVTVENENGAVQIEGMAGEIHASLSNGAITGKGVSGAVQASSVNGPVSFDLLEVGGEVSLATVNGPVRISLPASATATLSARTINGRIATSGLTLEDLRQASGRELDGRLNGGGPRIRLETTNGPVIISGR